MNFLALNQDQCAGRVEAKGVRKGAEDALWGHAVMVAAKFSKQERYGEGDNFSFHILRVFGGVRLLLSNAPINSKDFCQSGIANQAKSIRKFLT